MSTRRVSLILASLLCASVPAPAATLTFDDITTQVPGPVDIPDGYGGFDWNVVGQMGVIHANYGYGFPNGVASGQYMAFTNHGNPVEVSRATPFDFIGGFFGAMGRDDMTTTVTGYLGAQQMYQAVFLVDATAGHSETLNFNGIDRLRFETSGGTEVYYFGRQLTIDNFTFEEAAAVPEPASLLLFGSGLTLIARRRLAALRRRRER